MFKNKLKNYLILEFLKSYFFVLITLSLLIWIVQSAKALYLVTDNGLSINIYLNYVILTFPRSLSQLMLLSFLISLFLSIMKFQTNKELEIFWLNGISKDEVIKTIIKISFFLTFLALVFYIYIAPTAGAKSRNLLTNSEFSLISSLVKANNFNSPLKGLTIYVAKNDNQGNLEKVYIFENDKTIISKKGRVLNYEEKKFLELVDGTIHEKNSENNITTIKFEKTLYDFTKFETNVVTTIKNQEKNIFLLLEEYKKTLNRDILYELHKRFIKPLFLPLIAIICCFNLYSNDEKIKPNKIKGIVFSINLFLIIFLEILLNLSILNNFYRMLLYFFPITFFFTTYYFLKKFLISETRN